jgi:hypothetical protein
VATSPAGEQGCRPRPPRGMRHCGTRRHT